MALIDRYREFLPVNARTPALTLGEGGTPLLPAPRLAREIGVEELWLKLEGMNPTGSFKDRGMVVAVARAVEEGASRIVCASTGNTSASAAAYAAAARVEAIVVVPSGKIALGKLSQALMYGARLLAVHGNFDEALALVRRLAESHGMTLVNSINPFRIEGQATAAYEVCDALGGAPEGLCLPVGNAGNISAYWLGFRRYRERGRADGLPRMLGFQAEGAAPIVRGSPVANPETVATAIRIGNPASWKSAEAARDESNGVIGCVSDAEILAAWRDLARLEGVFCEPASAAGVAGLRRLAREGSAARKSRYVAVLTGHGLKDPQIAVDQFSPPTAVPADLDAIVAWLEAAS